MSLTIPFRPLKLMKKQATNITLFSRKIRICNGNRNGSLQININMSGDVTESASASKMAAAEIQIVNPQNLTKIERYK